MVRREEAEGVERGAARRVRVGKVDGGGSAGEKMRCKAGGWSEKRMSKKMLIEQSWKRREKKEKRSVQVRLKLGHLSILLSCCSFKNNLVK